MPDVTPLRPRVPSPGQPAARTTDDGAVVLLVGTAPDVRVVEPVAPWVAWAFLRSLRTGEATGGRCVQDLQSWALVEMRAAGVVVEAPRG